MIQILIPLCAILGFYLTTRQGRIKRKWGSIIGLSGQPFWFLTVDEIGVLIVAVFFTAVYAEVLIRSWLPENAQEPR